MKVVEHLQAKEATMAQRQLYIRPELGEKTMADAQRRECLEAPHGRCGDNITDPHMPEGCGERLNRDEWVCPAYPDCCIP